MFNRVILHFQFASGIAAVPIIPALSRPRSTTLPINKNNEKAAITGISRNHGRSYQYRLSYRWIRHRLSNAQIPKRLPLVPYLPITLIFLFRI